MGLLLKISGQQTRGSRQFQQDKLTAAGPQSYHRRSHRPSPSNHRRPASRVDNEHENMELALVKHEAPLEASPVSRLDLPASRDYLDECMELENEIDNVLRELRESQELEYKTAEEKLNGQKNHLRSLFQQLERERDVLSGRTCGNDPSSSLNAILDQVDQIKQQIMKVKEMEEVALGFGRTRSRILMEHFDMQMED